MAWYQPSVRSAPPARSSMCPVTATPITPDSVPAVLEMPLQAVGCAEGENLKEVGSQGCGSTGVEGRRHAQWTAEA